MHCAENTVALVAQRLVRSTTPHAAWKVLGDAMAGYGFENLLYGAHRKQSGTSLQKGIDLAVVLAKGDQAYLDEYFGNEYYKDSYSVLWSTQNTGSITWDVFARERAMAGPTKRELELIHLNERFGVNSGVLISFKGIVHSHEGLIGLCASPGMSQNDVNALWRSKGTEITTINQLFHLRVCTLPHDGQCRPLTSRQREVLRWYADGKSARDIGEIVGLSTVTVEKHFRLAREALNATTTAAAVQKALSLNQI